jgi:7-cyano-7-deazaguanine reductase
MDLTSQKNTDTKIKNRKKRNWAKNRDILKTISNPSKEAYEIKMKIPELTFEGVRGQPDFANLYITFYPDEKVIELKSLKEYFFAFRSQIYSYERIINVIYDDMMSIYAPVRLRLVMVCNPRGGISSKLTADSDWGARGGKDQFKDWVGQKEEW